MTTTTKAQSTAQATALVSLEAMIAETIVHWTTARDGVQKSLTGVLSFVHLTKSQDHAARLVNVLLDGMGDGINGNAIREWCGLHLNMILNKENKLSCKKFDIKAFSTTKAAAAAAPWYKLKKAKTAAAKSKEDLVEGSSIVVGDAGLKALSAIAAEAATRIETAKTKKVSA